MAGNWDGSVLVWIEDKDISSYCPPSGKMAPTGYRWTKIHDFEGQVEYVGYFRGRTAVGITVRLPSGYLCPMFLKDFDLALRFYGMEGTVMNGVWYMIKKGNNVGLAPRISQ